MFKQAEVIERHLTDDISKDIYENRLKYLVTRDEVGLINDLIESHYKNYKNENLEKTSKLDVLYKSLSRVNNIVIFGSGYYGKLILKLLKQTKYKNEKIFFCDSNEKRWNNVIEGVEIISPQNLLENYRESVIIIGSWSNKEDIYNQLKEMNYPENQILLPDFATNFYNTFGLSNYTWRITTLDNAYHQHENDIDEIVLFGNQSDIEYMMNVLRSSAYKNQNILLCYDSLQKQGKEFLGTKVISLDELLEYHGKSIVIIKIERIKGIFDFENNEMYKKLQNLNFPKDRIITLAGSFGNQYFDFFEPNEKEVFVDAGCFDGMTAVTFTKWAGKDYEYIYSLEPSLSAMKNCEQTFKEYGLKGEIINKGLYDSDKELYFKSTVSGSGKIEETGDIIIRTIALDDILDGKRVSFIKMDIEGAEYNALIGAEKTIKKWKPRLAICVYHKPEDILEIPALLLEMNPYYNFALRHYYISSTNETVLYAY